MQATLPFDLYRCDQVREIDRRAIEQYSLPGIVLMKRAARSAFEIAHSIWPENRCWLILCGGGNNAGDGYAFAALAKQSGHQAKVYYVKDPRSLSGEAERAYHYALQEQVAINALSELDKKSAELEQCVLVDALLGSGLSGAIKPNYQDAIDWFNSQGLPKLAIDIPSGLNGDSGAQLGRAVRADATVTFVGCKQGLFTAHGPACVGQLFFCDLDIPAQAYREIDEPRVKRTQLSMCSRPAPKAIDAHKGQCGSLMIVGGELGYGGAVILAAEAAAFSGCDMVSVCTRQEHVPALLMRRPEIMARGVPSGQELEPRLEGADFLLVGPGLGQTPWSEQMLQQAIKAEVPLVLDADALNILARGRIPWPKTAPVVITPHPGEAARLLNTSVAEIQVDRFAAVKNLQALCGGVAILKGAGTLIHDGDQCWVANVGNAGLATAGTGDVLSGVIAALMAQGLAAIDAVKLAVCVHGDAADLLREDVGTRGLLAGELIPYIRELLK